MRTFALVIVAILHFAGSTASAQTSIAQTATYRTLNDTFAAPQFNSLDLWKARAAYVREHILASTGLFRMPERTPLRANIFGEVRHPDYTVSKVFFESVPGFFVTGNLYRPIGTGPFPAILSPHGHWAYGRLENTPVLSAPGRAINLARQGFVVFLYDLIGYNDSRQLEHRLFGGPREYLWGLSVGGLQVWNGIRALDFLESLPYVRRDAIGMTGESGGGTQTFLISAIDDRVKVAAPVNMISLHMQGGCVCENPPGLRLDTNNVEIAATIAPRPLLMVSATGDWTVNTMEREYPAVRAIYSLYGATDRVHAVQFQAVHNYNRDSREAMYAWMARWLQQAPPDVRRVEKAFTPDPLSDVLVFHQRALPSGAVDAQAVDEQLDRRCQTPACNDPTGRARSRAAARAGLWRSGFDSANAKRSRHERHADGPSFRLATILSSSGSCALRDSRSCRSPSRRSTPRQPPRFHSSKPTTGQPRASEWPISWRPFRRIPTPRSSRAEIRRWQHCSRPRLCQGGSPSSMPGDSTRRAIKTSSNIFISLAYGGRVIWALLPNWPAVRSSSTTPGNVPG